MTPDPNAVSATSSFVVSFMLLIAGGVVTLVFKIIWDWLQKKNGNNGSIKDTESFVKKDDLASFTKAIDDLKAEFDKKFDTLSSKVDKWAEKLLEHYATKLEVGEAKKEQQELTIKVTENKTNLNLIMAQVKELFEKVNKVTSIAEKLSVHVKMINEEDDS